MKYLIVVHYPHIKENFAQGYERAIDALESYHRHLEDIERDAKWSERRNPSLTTRTLSISEADFLLNIQVTKFRNITPTELTARSVSELNKLAQGA